jgi:hypothetical protein
MYLDELYQSTSLRQDLCEIVTPICPNHNSSDLATWGRDQIERRQPPHNPRETPKNHQITHEHELIQISYGTP